MGAEPPWWTLMMASLYTASPLAVTSCWRLVSSITQASGAETVSMTQTSHSLGSSLIMVRKLSDSSTLGYLTDLGQGCSNKDLLHKGRSQALLQF